MGLRNRLSTTNVIMMNTAPATEKTEVTFSAMSKALFSDPVNDMVRWSVKPPHNHVKVQATRSMASKRTYRENSRSCAISSPVRSIQVMMRMSPLGEATSHILAVKLDAVQCPSLKIFLSIDEDKTMGRGNLGHQDARI